MRKASHDPAEKEEAAIATDNAAIENFMIDTKLLLLNAAINIGWDRMNRVGCSREGWCYCVIVVSTRMFGVGERCFAPRNMLICLHVEAPATTLSSRLHNPQPTTASHQHIMVLSMGLIGG